MQTDTIDTAAAFQQIVDDRRSVRIYDENIPLEDAAVIRSLERAVLSPNSSNLQLWEFYRIKSEAARKEMAHYCLDQKAASTARELIVIVTRKDKWKERSQYILAKARERFPENHGRKEKLIETYYTSVSSHFCTVQTPGSVG
jgi:nitroreductase